MDHRPKCKSCNYKSFGGKYWRLSYLGVENCFLGKKQKAITIKRKIETLHQKLRHLHQNVKLHLKS